MVTLPDPQPRSLDQRNRARTHGYQTGARRLPAGASVHEPGDYQWAGGDRVFAALLAINPPVSRPESMAALADALRHAAREIGRAADTLELSATGKIRAPAKMEAEG